VVATALNRADLLQRMGLYPGPPSAYEIPGLEYAGRVAACGERVRDLGVGDEVMGIVGGGAYAQRLAVTSARCCGCRPASPSPMPPPSPRCSSRRGTPSCCRRAHVGPVGLGPRRGQWGGHRSHPAGQGHRRSRRRHVQRAQGGGCAGPRRRPRARALAARLAGRPAGGRAEGVDTVLDVVGGDEVPRNLQALAPRGHVVQVGLMGSGRVAVDLGVLMAKRATLVGTVLRARPLEEKIAVTRRFAAEVLPLFTTGALRPVIDSRFPLERAADAHRHMEANANTGKIVLDVGA